MRKMLADLNNATFFLASKQKLTVLLGGNSAFSDIAKEIAKIDISYNGYTEHTEIDINQYRFLLIYNSPVEDISQHLKKIKENEEKFHKSLLKSMDKPSKIQSVIVHTATDEDAVKFRLYKEVCLNPHSTVIQLAEKIDIDRDYAINNIIKGLNMILDNSYNVTICLETMSGKGTEVGKNFSELKTIIDGVNYKDKISFVIEKANVMK